MLSLSPDLKIGIMSAFLRSAGHIPLLIHVLKMKTSGSAITGARALITFILILSTPPHLSPRFLMMLEISCGFVAFKNRESQFLFNKTRSRLESGILEASSMPTLLK